GGGTSRCRPSSGHLAEVAAGRADGRDGDGIGVLVDREEEGDERDELALASGRSVREEARLQRLAMRGERVREQALDGAHLSRVEERRADLDAEQRRRVEALAVRFVTLRLRGHVLAELRDADARIGDVERSDRTQRADDL